MDMCLHILQALKLFAIIIFYGFHIDVSVCFPSDSTILHSLVGFKLLL